MGSVHQVVACFGGILCSFCTTFALLLADYLFLVIYTRIVSCSFRKYNILGRLCRIVILLVTSSANGVGTTQSRRVLSMRGQG